MTVTHNAQNCVENSYRWMDQNVKLKAAAVNDRIELLKDAMYAEIDRIVTERGGDLAGFVGRVITEAGEDLADTKIPLNAHSIVLQDCDGTDRRMKLYVNECSEYLVYAGQILGAVGKIMGDEIYAETLVTGAPYQKATAVKKEEETEDGNAMDLSIGGSGGSVFITVASGPFSPDNVLIFDALSELEARIRNSTNPPDVLVVCGPFLDVAHPLIAAGTVNDSFGRPVTFDDLYREEIIPKLVRLARTCEKGKTRLVIVPAVNEARFDFPLPQPPLSKSTASVWQSLIAELPKNVEFVSNPATFVFKTEKEKKAEFEMVVSSTDALSSLNANLVFKAGPESETSLSRVDLCLDQMIRARCLFPVMPSALRVDSARRFALNMTSVPDLVVFPSISGRKINKTINGVMFVNPGFMSDANGVNSYIAELEVNVATRQVLKSEIVKL